MKVNLNIEEDDMFRQHVKSLIEGQVRHVLREQLSGIVAGEIAKLRLLQPNSPTLGDLVAAELKKQTSVRVTPSAVAMELQKQVKAEVDKLTEPSSPVPSEPISGHDHDHGEPGHVHDERMADALLGLRRFSPKVVYLGSYPRADRAIVHYPERYSDEVFVEARDWLRALISGAPEL